MRQTMSSGESPHVVRKAPSKERDYLRPDEVNRLIIAAGKRGRNPVRDIVLLRLIYRHGLRAKEARLARWSQLDLDNPGTKIFHVQRVKGSEDSTHTLDREPVCESSGRPLTGRMCSSPKGAVRSARTWSPGSSPRPLRSLVSGSTSTPHAPALDRVHAGGRRVGHPAHSGFLGASRHPEHGPIHQTESTPAGERTGTVSVWTGWARESTPIPTRPRLAAGFAKFTSRHISDLVAVSPLLPITLSRRGWTQ
jgi:Phage integrase family